MNIQPNKPGKPDALGRLFQLWGLTPANETLARAYLTNDQADESLLSGAERQIFSSFSWQDQQDICSLLKDVTGPDYTKNKAKVLRLLWAIGRSTAGFAALFEGHYMEMVSDQIFLQRCEILGQEAAAAMDAEYAAAMGTGYARVHRLHQIARTSPSVLLAAEELIADPRNSMADGVLAGVLLANTAPAEKKPGLLKKLLGAATDTYTKSGTPRHERQVEIVLAWTNAIIRSGTHSGLSDRDVDVLKAYIQAGDPSAPVPSISVPTAWQVPPENIFIVPLCSRRAIACMAAAAMFGSQHDDRMTCTLRVMAGLAPYDTLFSILCALPDDQDLSLLDQMLPHIPGGAVTVLRFIGKDYRFKLLDFSKKLVLRYHAAVDEMCIRDSSGAQQLHLPQPELLYPQGGSPAHLAAAPWGRDGGQPVVCFSQ